MARTLSGAEDSGTRAARAWRGAAWVAHAHRQLCAVLEVLRHLRLEAVQRLLVDAVDVVREDVRTHDLPTALVRPYERSAQACARGRGKEGGAVKRVRDAKLSGA